MSEAKQGDTVRVHYTGVLQSGRIFDTTSERDPIEFTIGQGDVIAGFEQAVIGMAPGDAKEEVIPAAEAFGLRREEMVQQVSRTDLPDHLELEVGKQLQVTDPGGQSAVLTITELTDSEVTLDANHPLAGEDLTFQIELVEVVAVA